MSHPPWPDIAVVEGESVSGMIEPWIDAYKIHEDDPKKLLTMTFHAFAKRYEERTMDTTLPPARVYVPPGTLMFPVSDQARRVIEDGEWGPWVDNSGVEE